MEEYEKEHEQASFNMALDTLKRLGEILREIKLVSSSPNFPKESKQEMKVNLIKQFFIQATPLMEIKFVEENQEEIINLTPSNTRILEKRDYGAHKFVGYDKTFDQKLEVKLDNILIKLQIELQKKGHFMPPSDESSLF